MGRNRKESRKNSPSCTATCLTAVLYHCIHPYTRHTCGSARATTCLIAVVPPYFTTKNNEATGRGRPHTYQWENISNNLHVCTVQKKKNIEWASSVIFSGFVSPRSASLQQYNTPQLLQQQPRKQQQASAAATATTTTLPLHQQQGLDYIKADQNLRSSSCLNNSLLLLLQLR